MIAPTIKSISGLFSTFGGTQTAKKRTGGGLFSSTPRGVTGKGPRIISSPAPVSRPREPEQSTFGKIRSYTRTSPGGISSLLSDFQSQQDAARKANEERYAQAMSIYDRIIGQYQPGGEFGKGFEAELERTKTRDVASGMQSLVTSGLAGTTQAAGLGKKFEEEVGAPARLKLEDLRMTRLSSALTAKAGVIERRQDVGPSQELIASLFKSIG